MFLPTVRPAPRRFALQEIRYELRLKRMHMRTHNPDKRYYAMLDACGTRGSCYWIKREYDDASQGS